VARSQWVYFDSSGRLSYRALDKGDRILDFSYAGYMGGGVAPIAPVKRTVAPSGGDDTAAIQAAIDEVSQMPLVNYMCSRIKGGRPGCWWIARRPRGWD